MIGPHWNLDPVYNTVTLTLPSDPTLRLDLPGVEDVLHNLGEFRAAMKPEVVRNFAMGGQVQAIPDPAWATESELMTGQSLLHLRDPRYGWLHYLIPREEARRLGEALLAQADAPLPEPGRERPN